MVKIRYDGYLAKEIPFFVVDDQLLALLKEKAKTRPELQTILSEL